MQLNYFLIVVQEIGLGGVDFFVLEVDPFMLTSTIALGDRSRLMLDPKYNSASNTDIYHGRGRRWDLMIEPDEWR